MMGKNTSVSLGEHFTRFVEEQVEQGRYGSASDVVRVPGLRRSGSDSNHLRRAVALQAHGFTVEPGSSARSVPTIIPVSD